jgi:hypothetical protein
MKKIALALTVTALALPAARTEDRLAESPWYPLQVGTTWSYKAGDSKFQMVVKSHEKVGDALTARIELVKDGKTVAAEHIGVTSEGVCRFNLIQMKDGQTITETPKPPILILKLPPKKGESFTVDSRAAIDPRGGSKTYKGVFKIAEEDVTVPAGTFKGAVRVTSQDLDADGLKPTVTTWYAEKVGMIKQVIRERDQTLTIELEKLTPGK